MKGSQISFSNTDCHDDLPETKNFEHSSNTVMCHEKAWHIANATWDLCLPNNNNIWCINTLIVVWLFYTILKHKSLHTHARARKRTHVRTHTHTHTHNTSVWFVLTFNKIIISFWPFLSNVFINFRLPTYRPLMSETTWTLQRHGDRAEFILSDSKWTQNRTVRKLFVPIANGIPCYLGFFL